MDTDRIYPELGDIWMDDEGDYFLFLSKPSYDEDWITATVLMLNTGKKFFHEFAIDPETTTLYDYFQKVS